MLDFLAKLTGGRPMKLIGFEFTDVVVNRPVFSWRDRMGRCWLAHGPWSLFRLSISR